MKKVMADRHDFQNRIILKSLIANHAFVVLDSLKMRIVKLDHLVKRTKFKININLLGVFIVSVVLVAKSNNCYQTAH